MTCRCSKPEIDQYEHLSTLFPFLVQLPVIPWKAITYILSVPMLV